MRGEKKEGASMTELNVSSSALKSIFRKSRITFSTAVLMNAACSLLGCSISFMKKFLFLLYK